MSIDEIIKTIEIAKSEVEWYYPAKYYVAFAEALIILKEKRDAKACWIKNMTSSVSKTRGRKTRYSIYKCSRCGATNGKYGTPFCPYCGAEMGEGKEPES